MPSITNRSQSSGVDAPGLEGLLMVKTASLFSQLLQHFPRNEFQSLVKEHAAEHGAKGFRCWNQFVAMLFCHLARADSLREICNGLSCCLGRLSHLGFEDAPKRSTLSYANRHRPASLFEALFFRSLSSFRGQGALGTHSKPFRFKNKLMSLDATTISLCLELFPWAKFRRAKELPQNRPIRADEIIRLSSAKGQQDCPDLLRRIVVWDAENEREIVLLSNHLDFGATTISAIYKERWQIEIFFKTLKQNLRIRTFIGTSENALRIQIWTALIALLLLKWMHYLSQANWSFSNLASMLRLNLFTYLDLEQWIHNPFGTPPTVPDHEQLALPY